MANYLYGAVTVGFLAQAYAIIDVNVPNSLWYWIDLVLPL